MKDRSYKKLILLILTIFLATFLTKGLFPKKHSSDLSSISYSSKNFPQIKIVDLGEGIKLELVLINPGSFLMGSNNEEGDEDETPKHNVSILKPFYLGKFEITQEQWSKIMDFNPSYFKGGKKPVDSVSYNDSIKFLEKLSKKTGLKFTLPTEAQWEYAARSNSTSSWSFGDNSSLISDYAWLKDNSANTTHEVGLKKSNSFGICDMYGNVQEWCLDWYGNYSGTSSNDPSGPSNGDSKVLRGGAWGDNPENLRSAYRNCLGPNEKTNGVGFRCVLSLD